MPLTQREVHPVDPPLSTIAVEYGKGEFIGEQIFRTVESNKYTARYFVYAQGTNRAVDYTWQQGTDRPMADWDIESKTVIIDEHAPTDTITDKIRNDADPPLQLEIDTANNLTKEVMTEFELAVATKATTQANYPSSNRAQLTGLDQWSDPNSDPLDDILVGIQAIALQVGVGPSRMGLAMGHQTATQLFQHATILDFFKRQGIKLPNAQALAPLFSLQEVLVGSAVYNSAKKGQSVTQAWIWGKHAVLYVIPPGGRPGVKTMQYGAAFRVKQQGGGTRVVERWREQKLRADFISVVDSWAIEFTARDSSNDSLAGYLIEDAVA